LRATQAKRQPLEGLEIAIPKSDDELLAIDESLGRLQKLDPTKAALVKIRYFGGLTIPETAQTLGISVPPTGIEFIGRAPWRGRRRLHA
jgi:DNA-directed RNA polymerase specialized sigma24 family protein